MTSPAPYRAAWSRKAGPAWCVPVGVLLAVAGVVLTCLTSAAWWLFPALPVGLLIVLFGGTRVTVDARGVSVSAARLPLRRFRLDRIAAARSGYARLADLGGFGYRVVPGRHAVSLRSGDALWLELTNGRQFVVTVDDAGTAVRLITRLLGRP
ncbi:hypothetical protein [Streptomyces lichenis]|uniref:PH domain-containing protein n=1 Tax=Streptomyces lichenis TaxID=2306967 RepID=A0ABT0IJ12_9ACTN|nr:hypothetical protein [Streptomyces lichenis]MCK8681323.1 hypothetical protein [Streptomyces lichenis]